MIAMFQKIAFRLVCATVVLGTGSVASAQWGHSRHNYGQPYSYTYQRIGSVGFHNYSNGTTGTSIYSGGYRFDSFSNPRQGWQGSGVIRTQPPYYSSYQRWGW
jgi:hypothetical protein